MLKPKTFIAKLITKNWIGEVIRYICRGKLQKYNLTFDVNDDIVSSSFVASLFWGLYESAEIRFIRKYFNDSELDVIELGGSIGIVSSVLMSNKNPQKKGIVVEANPTLISLIRHNMLLNKIQNVRVINLAIPIESTITEYHFEIGSNTTTSKIIDIPNSNSIILTCKSLSKIIEENNIQDYALICDIEGAEIGILLNDIHSLKRARLIIIETHNINFKNRLYTPEIMKVLLIKEGFILTAEHGSVFVFKR